MAMAATIFPPSGTTADYHTGINLGTSPSRKALYRHGLQKHFVCGRSVADFMMMEQPVMHDGRAVARIAEHPVRKRDAARSHSRSGTRP